MALTTTQKRVGKALRDCGVPNWDKREVAVALAPALDVKPDDQGDFVRLASDNNYPA